MICDNEWHHIAVTYNSTHLCMYLDSVLEDTLPVTVAVKSCPEHFKIGSSYDGAVSFPVDGTIDEVAIYNVGLNQTEVTELYDSWEDKPVSMWSFDEGSGSTAFDGRGGYDGTIHDAHWATGMRGSALYYDGDD